MVQRQVFTGAWDCDLALDLDTIWDWRAAAVVTLVERWELDRYRVPLLGAEVPARGMDWPGCWNGGWTCWGGARNYRKRRAGCWRHRGVCDREGNGAQGRSRTTDTAIFKQIET